MTLPSCDIGVAVQAVSRAHGIPHLTTGTWISALGRFERGLCRFKTGSMPMQGFHPRNVRHTTQWSLGTLCSLS